MATTEGSPLTDTPRHPVVHWEPSDGGRWATVLRVLKVCQPGPVWGGWVEVTLRSLDGDHFTCEFVPSKAREFAEALIAVADAADAESGKPVGGG